MQSKSHYDLALSYYKLNTIKKDPIAAFNHFEKAALLGYNDAYYFLGQIYEEGLFVTKDIEKAINYYNEGYSKKSYKCGFGLGLNALNQNEVEKASIYFSAVYPYLLEEANKEDAVSNYLVGGILYLGMGPSKDINIAMKNFLKADELGYADASYMLGFLYENPMLGLNDQAKAHFYYNKASELGHSEASYLCGVEMLKNNNIAKAINYLEKAANDNHLESIYTLALIYQEIEPDNPKKRYELFEKAAKREHLDSIYVIAYSYEMGIYYQKDLVKAMIYYELAAKEDHPQSLYQLGMIEMHKANPNKKKMFDYFKRASEKKHMQALYNLGIMYQLGDYVDTNKIKAYELFKESAKLGFSHAQYNLAIMYLKGDGIPVNKKEGMYWLEKASDQGLEVASKWLLKLLEIEKNK